MASKTIKKWITINGNHVPVYEDGSLGGAAEKIGLNKESSDTSDYSSEEILKIARSLGSYSLVAKYIGDKTSFTEKEAQKLFSDAGIGSYWKRRNNKEQIGYKGGKEQSVEDISKRIANGEYDHEKSLNGPENSAKELEDAYKRGQVAPETLRAAGYTDGELAELSKAGRADALKRVEEGNNKSTYIDPMGNLNQKKTRSAYEQNYNEDFRDMSKSQAREERLGKIEISDNIRSQFSDKSDEELLTTSRNAYKYKFSREESKALDDELKSRGYDYIQGGWKKNRSSEKSIKIGDKEVGVSKTKPESSESYDKANAAYKKSEARSQKTELARAKETGDYSGIFASTYNKMSLSEVKNIGRQLGLSDFALSGSKSEIIADILRIKRKK